MINKKQKSSELKLRNYEGKLTNRLVKHSNVVCKPEKQKQSLIFTSLIQTPLLFIIKSRIYYDCNPPFVDESPWA